MNRSNLARRKPSKGVLLPRWMALILTPVVFLLGHGAVPQELSRLAARHGWAHGRPGWLNLLGLILIGVTILFGAKHTLSDRAACRGRSTFRQRRGKILSHFESLPLSPLLLEK